MILADIARERMQLAQQRRVVKQQPATPKPPEPEPVPQLAPRDLLYQKVDTPYGPGKVLQVFSGRVTVLLDNEPDRVAFFDGCGPPEKWKRVKIIGHE